MENKNFKKIIIYIIIILFIGIFSYFIFFKKESSREQLQGDSVSFPIDDVVKVDLGEDFTKLKENPDYLNNQNSDSQIPILRQISSEPVAGAIIFKKDLKKDDFYTIRYMEKATGHIYETNTNSLTIERISNKTIPKINTTNWLDGNTLFFNYLDDNVIKTYSAVLTQNATSTKTELEGIYLQNNIQNIIYFNNNLFYLLKNGSNTNIITTNIKNTDIKEITTSPLTEWLITNIDSQKVAFTTKTTSKNFGYLFIFDSLTKKFNKILGEKINLSTLVNKNLDILYSYNTKNGPKLSFYNYEKKINSDFPITTFPEKCIWSKNNLNLYCSVPTQTIFNTSLENWYKGNILFDDNIWKIDIETNQAENITPLTNLEGEGIDATRLQITDDNKYLIFINKKDYSLWGLQIISNKIF